MTRRLLFLMLLWPALAQAQNAPIVATTLKSTSTAPTSTCVGCPLGSTTPAADSGLTAATVVLTTNGPPSVTTNKIYRVGSALFFNGLGLATGSSISGTTGTVPKFTGATSLGDSNATISGSNWTITGALTATSFTGTVATSNLSGNYVATVGSGTGITSSVTSGAGAATAISLNNTAVTPSSYGSATAIPVITIDQQGRATSATTATPQLTLTSTYFSSLSGANLTSIPAGQLTGSIADARLSANVPLLNGTNSWTGSNTLGFAADTWMTSIGDSKGRLYFQTNSMTYIKSGRATSELIGFRDSADVDILTIAAAGLELGSNNITDAIAAPTITSGAGSTATIAGKDFAFTVATQGVGITGDITVAFNATYANAPICVGTGLAGVSGAKFPVTMVITTTSVRLQTNDGTNWGAGTNLGVLCRGY